MFAFLSSFFDTQAKTLKRYRQVVDVINSHESSIQSLTDDQLKAKTAEFRQRLANGETLEQLLPEAFAVVRETSHRVLGQRHYDVQLMAGIAFHEGKVAEQRTGEGKTLSATTALYLNALEEKGSHLVTVNDYLSQVGAGWMGAVYHALGMSVGVIIHDQAYLYDPDFTGEKRGDERLEHFRPVPRKAAYAADITYGTNNEFGFDYLRDNMAQRLTEQVQRPQHFAIVDEADSILIDEARTPLIISAPDSEPTEKYVSFAKLVRQLSPKADYAIDEKLKTATLTDLGVKRLERLLGVTNLYEESFDTLHHVEQALKAATVYQRDIDYVVKDDEVIIVDEHTGRLMNGRRYSDGLHQAIEAKEGVKIQQESRTLATISLQNYFRLYGKLAGMSGTAVTEAEEFLKIYDMDVVVIPTHREAVRQDYPDVIYKTQRAKLSAIAREIEEVHATNRPILIGTRSIEQNQVISKMLSRKNITHQVLNAKNHENEAFIIAEAGKPGAITVATNIAGRGVDIVLGGATPERRNYESEKEFKKAREEWQTAHDAVVTSGGLHIVGASRHEARRIDNQLRGRAGRQGDPGSSRFFVSLEDEIMRIFGGEQIQRLMDAMKIEENMPIEHPLITKAITQAQVRVEGFFFDQRKSLVEYDDVMNRQREVIYGRRQAILQSMEESDQDKSAETKELPSTLVEESGLGQRLRDTFEKSIDELLLLRESDGFNETELQNITNEVANLIPFDTDSLGRIRAQLKDQGEVEAMKDFLMKLWDDTYTLRRDTLGPVVMREIELFIFLSTLDEQWMNHLDTMTNLRDGIWLRGGKEQALAEYKKEAFQLFQALIQRIEVEAVKKVFRLQVAPQEPIMPRNIQTSGPSDNLADALTPLDDTTQPRGAALSDMAAALARTSGASPAVVRSEPGVPKKAKKGKKKRRGSYL